MRLGYIGLGILAVCCVLFFGYWIAVPAHAEKGDEPAAGNPAVKAPDAAAPAEAKPAEKALEEKPLPAAEPKAEAAPKAEPAKPAAGEKVVIEELEKPAPAKEPAEAKPAAAPKAEVAAPKAEAPAEAKPAAPITPEAEMKPAQAVATPATGVAAMAIDTNALASAPDEKARAEMLSNMEKARRQAMEIEGQRQFKNAMDEYKRQDYVAAAPHFQEALKNLPVRQSNKAMRDQATEALTECDYRIALDIVRKNGNLADAKAKMAAAAQRSPENQKVLKLKARIDEMLAVPPTETATTVTSEGEPAWDTKAVRDKKTRAMDLVVEGKGFLAIRDFNEARARFEAALALEPENREAMKCLKITGRDRFDTSTLERKGTAANMMADVREAWNPKSYANIPPPKTELTHTNVISEVLLKMQEIRIPEIEFRQANVQDVVAFLRKASIENDFKSPEEKKGVNIILNLQPGKGSQSAPAASDSPFAAPTEGAPGAAGVPEITFAARHITLLAAIQTVTKVAGLKYMIDGDLVIIVPSDFSERTDFVTKMYPVEPTFMERLSTLPAPRARTGGRELAPLGGEGGGGEGGAPDVKAYFVNLGVPFPTGSSISYVAGLGKLIVANTPDNLIKFEDVLRELNVVPQQVEIEARFVEVSETDLQELGLEWLLKDNWELLQKNGLLSAPLGGAERIQADANSSAGGFTAGNRFYSYSSGVLSPVAGGQGSYGDILSLSSVLTNPELSLILHALQQSGHADELSAPKVTTRSGQEASIRVVTEYIYPTEFTVQGGTITAGGGTAGNTVTEPWVQPGGFQTREVGVILTVTPEVSPNGNTINLTMTPQVVSEPTYYQYGSTIKRADGSTLTLNMPQPFFHTRQISTSISIYDGATVVMGGLITETLTTINDQIPGLGDLPLIGRLFQSKSTKSDKRNLLIFVTARLVDPSGHAIRKPGAESAVMKAAESR